MMCMQPERNINHQRGVTIVELAATMVVMAIIVIGLAMNAHTIQLNHSRDALNRNVKYYANLAMAEILKEFQGADNIQIIPVQGYDKIIVKKTDDNGVISTSTITAKPHDGIYINDQPIVDGIVYMSDLSKGKTKRIDLELRDLWAEEERVIRPSLVDFAESTWEIGFEIWLITESGSNRTVIDKIQQTRKIFMSNLYIKRQNQDPNNRGDYGV